MESWSGVSCSVVEWSQVRSGGVGFWSGRVGSGGVELSGAESWNGVE